MASIKFRLDTRRADKDGKYPLKIIIYHNQKNTAISIGIGLDENQWDDNRQSITRKHNDSKSLNNDLDIIYGKYTQRIKELTDSGKIKIMTATDIKEKLVNSDSDYFSNATFSDYLANFIATAKIKTQSYLYTQSTIAKYTRSRTLMFEDINITWLNKFVGYMTAAGLAVNSQFTVLKCIRSIYNRAIDDETVGQDTYPFRKFKIKTERTAKRSLTIEQLRALRDYPCQEHQVKYRDIFMLVFYLIGINMVDLLHLKEIKNGRVEFKRAKTGRLYSIKVEPEAMAIIDRYRGVEYLLDIMDSYGNYRDFLHRTNKNLQSIGELTMVANEAKDPSNVRKNKKSVTPIFPDLTTYWARHTWATVAAGLDTPKETIAAALGHGGNDVTDIYIRFDESKIDTANRRVIDYSLSSEN